MPRCRGAAGLAFIATCLAAGGVPRLAYVPQRVYDSRAERFTDFETMLAGLSRVDVVFVGERHGDPATHRVQLAMLQGLARRNVPVVVALEMFDRDVQPVLDDHLAGRIGEDSFLERSRPWPGYQANHRPLVEFGRGQGWAVFASNVPRRIAAAIAHDGLAALEALPPEERAHAADDLRCPTEEDPYFERFVEQMRAHPLPDDEASPEAREALVERMYYAQCVRDETMAESVAAARAEAAEGTVVVHFNGAFHSDHYLGTAARTARRLPGASVAVVSILPVEDLDALEPGPEAGRADYLVFTIKQE